MTTVPTDAHRDPADDAFVAEMATALADTVYVLRLEPDVAFEFVSPSVEALVGYSPAEHYADPELGFRLLDPRDVPTLQSAAQAQIDQVIDLRLRWIARDGRLIWTAHRCVKRKRADGSVALYGAVRDVTDLVEARESEAQERIRLQALLDAMLDPFVLLAAVRDDQGAILDFEYADANVAALDFHGMTRDELLGSRLLSLHPAATSTELFDMYVGVVDRGLRLVLDDWSYPQDIYDGRVRRYDVRAVKAGDAVSQTWRDVTERHDQALELAHSNERFRLLAENASDVVFRGDAHGVIEWISPSVEHASGWVSTELVGRAISDFIHPDDVGGFIEATSDPIDEGRVSVEVRIRLSTGSYRWFEVNARPAVVDGRVDAWIGGAKDIQVQHEQWELLTDALESLPDASLMVFDTNLRYRVARGEAITSAGIDPGDLEGSLVSDVLSPERWAVYEPLYLAALQGQSSTTDMPSLDGSQHFMIRVNPIVDGSGTIVGGVAIAIDVSEQHRAEAELRQSEERYRLLAEHSSDVVLRIKDGVVLWASPSLHEMLGWRPEEWQDRPIREFTHPDDIGALVETDAEPSPVPGVRRWRMRNATGSYHWIEAHSKASIEAGSADGWHVVSFRTIDHEVRIEQDLERRATFDDLTGVLKRDPALTRLADMGRQSQRPGDDFAVLFCDVDNLKAINDTWGHAAGDQVLRKTAARIRTTVRQGDMIARLGGDEFLVILDGVASLDDVMQIAEKVLAATARPVHLPVGEVSATLSVGAALAGQAEPVDRLLGRADAAMYEAKRRGRGQVVVAASLPD